MFACFTVIPVPSENSVVPDQMTQNAASDLGLHNSPMFILWDAKL